MINLVDHKYEAHLEAKFQRMTFKEKMFFSRKLILEGFIKDAPLLRSWWLEDKIFWNYPSTVEHAMDRYIETHRNMIYLEDFIPLMLSEYPGVGPAKIKEVKHRIDLYLNSKKK